LEPTILKRKAFKRSGVKAELLNASKDDSPNGEVFAVKL